MATEANPGTNWNDLLNKAGCTERICVCLWLCVAGQSEAVSYEQLREQLKISTIWSKIWRHHGVWLKQITLLLRFSIFTSCQGTPEAISQMATHPHSKSLKMDYNTGRTHLHSPAQHINGMPTGEAPPLYESWLIKQGRLMKKKCSATTTSLRWFTIS